MWLCVGMASVGLVVGSLTAFSSAHLAAKLFLAFFALIGGSVAALFHKIPPGDRALAGGTLCAISLGSLAGIYSGIVVRQYQWLTPPPQRTWAHPPPAASGTPATVQTAGNQTAPVYLDNMEQDAIKGILIDFKADRYDLPQAVERIKGAMPKTAVTPVNLNQKPPQPGP